MGTLRDVRLALVTAVVAVALGAGVASPGVPAADRPPAAPPAAGGGVEPGRVERHDEAAAAALVAAWERSLAGAFTVVSRFERRLEGDRGVTAGVVVAQRPPDRLVRHGAAAAGRLAGRLVACPVVDDRPVGCTDRGPAPPYAGDAAREVAGVRRLVSGPGARYAVTAERGGCFRARLTVWTPAPPWGTAAVFCFDPATGAPTVTAVTRPEGVDRTVATSVRPVRDTDLRPPGG